MSARPKYSQSEKSTTAPQGLEVQTVTQIKGVNHYFGTFSALIKNNIAFWYSVWHHSLAAFAMPLDKSHAWYSLNLWTNYNISKVIFNNVLIDILKSSWNLCNISRLLHSFNQKWQINMKADVCFTESKCNRIHG